MSFEIWPRFLFLVAARPTLHLDGNAAFQVAFSKVIEVIKVSTCRVADKPEFARITKGLPTNRQVTGGMR